MLKLDNKKPDAEVSNDTDLSAAAPSSERGAASAMVEKAADLMKRVVLGEPEKENHHERARHDGVEQNQTNGSVSIQNQNRAAGTNRSVDSLQDFMSEMSLEQSSGKRRRGRRRGISDEVMRQLQALMPEEVIQDLFEQILEGQAQAGKSGGFSVSPEQVRNIALELHKSTDDLFALLALDGRADADKQVEMVADYLQEVVAGLQPEDASDVAEALLRKEALEKSFAAAGEVAKDLAIDDLLLSANENAPSEHRVDPFFDEFSVYTSRYPQLQGLLEEFIDRERVASREALRVVLEDACQRAVEIQSALQARDSIAAIHLLSDLSPERADLISEILERAHGVNLVENYSSVFGEPGAAAARLALSDSPSGRDALKIVAVLQDLRRAPEDEHRQHLDRLRAAAASCEAPLEEVRFQIESITGELSAHNLSFPPLLSYRVLEALGADPLAAVLASTLEMTSAARPDPIAFSEMIAALPSHQRQEALDRIAEEILHKPATAAGMSQEIIAVSFSQFLSVDKALELRVLLDGTVAGDFETILTARLALQSSNDRLLAVQLATLYQADPELLRRVDSNMRAMTGNSVFDLATDDIGRRDFAHMNLLRAMRAGRELPRGLVVEAVRRSAEEIGTELGEVRALVRRDQNQSYLNQLESSRKTLLDASRALSSTVPELDALAEVVLTDFESHTRLSAVSKQAWRFGYQQRQAELIHGRGDGSYFTRSMELLMEEQTEFLSQFSNSNTNRPLSEALVAHNRAAYDYVQGEMRAAHRLAGRIQESIDGWNYSHSTFVSIITRGNYDSLESLRRSGRRTPYFNSQTLNYLRAAYEDTYLTDNQSLESRLREESLGSWRSRNAVTQVLNPAKASADPYAEQQLHDLSQYFFRAPSERLATALSNGDRASADALRLRASLTKENGAFTALRVIEEAPSADAALTEYQAIFGSTFAQDSARCSEERVWVLDRERTEREGVARGRALPNSADIVARAVSGEEISDQMLSEYGLARLKMLATRRGMVLARDKHDLSTEAVRQIDEERTELESGLAAVYARNPSLRAAHEEFFQSVEDSSRSFMVRRQVESLMFDVRMAEHGARGGRGTEGRIRQRALEAKRGMLSRYIQRHSAVTATVDFSEWRSNLESSVVGQASGRYQAASRAADNLYSAMHLGWNVFGTDEDAIYRAFRRLDQETRELTFSLYNSRYRRSLGEDMRDELGGRDAERAAAHSQGRHLDAEQIAIYQAARGWGSNNTELNAALERARDIIVEDAREDSLTEVGSLRAEAAQQRFRGNDSEASRLERAAQHMQLQASREDGFEGEMGEQIKAAQSQFEREYDERFEQVHRSFEEVLDVEADDPELSAALWRKATSPEEYRALKLAVAIEEGTQEANEAIATELDDFIEDFFSAQVARKSDGSLDFACRQLSQSNMQAFYEFASQGASQEVRAELARRTDNGQRLAGMFEGPRESIDESLVRSYEGFVYEQVIVPRYMTSLADGTLFENEEVKQAWAERLEGYSNTAGYQDALGDISLRDLAARELSGVGESWALALLDGDYAAGRAHHIQHAVLGLGTYDELLNKAFAAPRVVAIRLASLEQGMNARRLELAGEDGVLPAEETLAADEQYQRLAEERQRLEEAARAGFHRTEEAYATRYRSAQGYQLWERVAIDVSSERLAIYRQAANAGFLDTVTKLQLALEQDDEDALIGTLTGLTTEEIDLHAAELKRRENPDSEREPLEHLRRRCFSATSGDDENEVAVLLIGRPETAEQMREILDLRFGHVRSGLTSFHDLFGGAGERLENEYGTFLDLEARFRSSESDGGEDISPEELRRLRASFNSAVQTAATAQTQKNTVSDMSIDVAATGMVTVGTVGALFSGGTSMALTVAGLSILAAGGARIIGGKVLKGQGYGVDNLGRDAGLIVIDTASLGLGVGIGAGLRHLTSKTLGTVLTARASQQAVATRTAIELGEEVLEQGGRRLVGSGGRAAGELLGEASENSARVIAREGTREGSEQALSRGASQLTTDAAEQTTSRAARVAGPRQGETSAQYGQRLIDSSRSLRMAQGAAEGIIAEGPANMLASAGQIALDGGFQDGNWNLDQIFQQYSFGAGFGMAFGMLAGVRTPRYIRTERKLVADAVASGKSPEEVLPPRRELAAEMRQADAKSRAAYAAERAEMATARLADPEIELSSQQRRDLEVQSRETVALERAEAAAARKMDVEYRSSDTPEVTAARSAAADAEVQLSVAQQEARQRFGQMLADFVRNPSSAREAFDAWRGSRASVRGAREEIGAARSTLRDSDRIARRLEGIQQPSNELRSLAAEAMGAGREFGAALRRFDFPEALSSFRSWQQAEGNFLSARNGARSRQALARDEVALRSAEDNAVSDASPELQEQISLSREDLIRWRGIARDLRSELGEELAKFRRLEFPSIRRVAELMRADLPHARTRLADAESNFARRVEQPARVQADGARVPDTPEAQASAAQHASAQFEVSQAGAQARTELGRSLWDVLTVRPRSAYAHFQNFTSSLSARNAALNALEPVSRVFDYYRRTATALGDLNPARFGDAAQAYASASQQIERFSSSWRRPVQTVRDLAAGDLRVSELSDALAARRRAGDLLELGRSRPGRAEALSSAHGDSPASDQLVTRLLDAEENIASSDYQIERAETALSRAEASSDSTSVARLDQDIAAMRDARTAHELELAQTRSRLELEAERAAATSASDEPDSPFETAAETRPDRASSNDDSSGSSSDDGPDDIGGGGDSGGDGPVEPVGPQAAPELAKPVETDVATAQPPTVELRTSPVESSPKQQRLDELMEEQSSRMLPKRERDLLSPEQLSEYRADMRRIGAEIRQLQEDMIDVRGAASQDVTARGTSADPSEVAARQAQASELRAQRSAIESEGAESLSPYEQAERARELADLDQEIASLDPVKDRTPSTELEDSVIDELFFGRSLFDAERSPIDQLRDIRDSHGPVSEVRALRDEYLSQGGSSSRVDAPLETGLSGPQASAASPLNSAPEVGATSASSALDPHASAVKVDDSVTVRTEVATPEMQLAAELETSVALLAPEADAPVAPPRTRPEVEPKPARTRPADVPTENPALQGRGDSIPALKRTPTTTLNSERTSKTTGRVESTVRSTALRPHLSPQAAKPPTRVSRSAGEGASDSTKPEISLEEQRRVKVQEHEEELAKSAPVEPEGGRWVKKMIRKGAVTVKDRDRAFDLDNEDDFVAIWKDEEAT